MFFRGSNGEARKLVLVLGGFQGITMSEATAPAFWSHLGRQFSAEAKGLAAPWIAPVAKFVARDGFGESSWLEAIPDTVIAVRLGGAHVVKRRGLGSGATTARGGNFTLQPKGTSNWFAADEGCVFGQIHLPDRLLDRASDSIGQSPVSGRLRPDLIFNDNRNLNANAENYILRALSAREPPTCLEMEGRALLLLDSLLALHGASRPTGRISGGLSGRQLRQVTDFMTEHMARDLVLDELAALVNLSTKHFARAFRQSTGIPPHRWLIERRIDRAKKLLSAGDLSMAEIALTCGFADQSHFTAAFRKFVGATPGSFRRDAQA
jgi:AraC family transcriptional regulator